MRKKKIKRVINSHASGFSSIFIYGVSGGNLESCIIQLLPASFLALPIDIGQVDLAQ